MGRVELTKAEKRDTLHCAKLEIYYSTTKYSAFTNIFYKL